MTKNQMTHLFHLMHRVHALKEMSNTAISTLQTENIWRCTKEDHLDFYKHQSMLFLQEIDYHSGKIKNDKVSIWCNKTGEVVTTILGEITEDERCFTKPDYSFASIIMKLSDVVNVSNELIKTMLIAAETDGMTHFN